MNRRVSFLALALIISSNLFATREYDYIGAPIPLGTGVSSLSWCNGCDFLAAVAPNGFSTSLIQIYGFNQNTETLENISTLSLALPVLMAEWCTTCSYLAVSGADRLNDGLIQIYSFDPSNPGNLSFTCSTTIGQNVIAVDWCQECNLLAVCGIIGLTSNNFIQLFTFDGNNLTSTGDMINVNYSVNSLKWCPDCRHLVVVGLTADIPGAGLVSIYSFDPENPGTPELVYSLTIEAFPASVDVCDDCQFIAVGGNTQELTGRGVIDIFSFDAQATASLSLVASVTISDPVTLSRINSVNWCNCATLAAGGAINNEGVAQIYYFDQVSTLTLLQSFPVGVTIRSVNWCGDCAFLAAGGRNSSNGFIQLFGQAAISAPTNLTTQKICHRFPTQLDMINTICWDAVINAFEYNVYADQELTILLANITEPPLCYSQHQICNGAMSTYYVTAVDVEGLESEPAIVTV